MTGQVRERHLATTEIHSAEFDEYRTGSSEWGRHIRLIALQRDWGRRFLTLEVVWRLKVMWKSHEGNVEVAWRSCKGRAKVVQRSCEGRAKVTWKSCEGRVKVVWRSRLPRGCGRRSSASRSGPRDSTRGCAWWRFPRPGSKCRRSTTKCRCGPLPSANTTALVSKHL